MSTPDGRSPVMVSFGGYGVGEPVTGTATLRDLDDRPGGSGGSWQWIKVAHETRYQEGNKQTETNDHDPGNDPPTTGTGQRVEQVTDQVRDPVECSFLQRWWSSSLDVRSARQHLVSNVASFLGADLGWRQLTHGCLERPGPDAGCRRLRLGLGSQNTQAQQHRFPRW